MTGPAESAKLADSAKPEAAPPAGGEAGQELGLLKKLLFRAEQSRLDALQGEIDRLASRVGDDQRFEAATADVLAGALRRAEVARHRELSQAMAPLVVAAIRSEIVNSRDIMVEALYPITGRLVAAAVSNAFRDLVERIETRLDALLSTQIWRLRVRSWLTGRPLSEILLEAAQQPAIQRMFALERDTGRLLARWPAGGAEDESAELASGLLAAISQFATQAFAHQHGELRTLDMGASRILLRASARMIVAAEFSGQPHAGDETRMDRALFDLIEAAPNGPSEADLARLAPQFAAAPPQRKRSPAGRIVFSAAVAALLYWVATGPAPHFLNQRRLDAAFAQAAAQQKLGAWPLKLVVDHDERLARIDGLAPPDVDLDKLTTALRGAGTPYRIESQVERITTLAATGDVEARLAKGAQDTAQESRDLAQGIARDARAATEKLAAAQTAGLATLDARLARQEDWRSGQEAREHTPEARLAAVARDTAIWFGELDDYLDSAAADAAIAVVVKELKASGGRLRVVGYTDTLGGRGNNLTVSKTRADRVVAAIIAQGVDAQQVFSVGRGDEAAIAPEVGLERRRNRRVTFEPIRPTEQAP